MTNSIPYTDYQSAQDKSQIYYKPDTIEPVANDHTQTNLKPDTIDTPVYEKPNAYEDLDEQMNELSIGIQGTELEHNVTNQEKDDDGEEPIHTTIVRYKTRKTKMAPPPSAASTPTPTSPPPHTWSSSSLLSHVSSTATTTTTIQTEDDVLAQDRRHSHRPLSSTSLDPQAISPSLSSTSTIDSTNSSTTTATSSSTSKQMLLDSLKRRPMDDVAKYDLRKHSLVQPHHHDIYIGGTKHLLFRKRQPHSYSWGFQNILYRVGDNDQQQQHHHCRLGRHGTKVAEARRRAFQKQITVEWGIDEKELDEKSNTSVTEDDDGAMAYKGTGEQNDGNMDDDDDETDRQAGTKSDHLINTNNTRLLFVYTTLFDNGFYIRWKRPSLVSHDMICEIRRVDSDDDVDGTNNNDNPSDSCGGSNSKRFSLKKKHKKKWQLLAEFDSHGMGYLIHIGQLVVDKRALALVDRPEHLEAHLLITCCTLVDFMRELVQKAVGLSNGGVA